MARGRRLGRSRLLLGTVATIVVVVALGLVAYFSPLMSVRTTDIHDNRAVPADQILDAARVGRGTPLLQVDTASIARRIAAIPAVASARVQRSYPSTLTITIVEREPVATVSDGQKVHVLDRTGVGFQNFDKATGIPPEVNRLPVLDTPNAGPADPTTRAALGAVADMPPDLSGLIVRIRATSPVDIQFTLRGNKTVVWGDSERGAEKARTLKALLTRKATMYNVSSPEFPAFR